MNRVIIIGNLSKEPDLRLTNNGTAVCTFSVAVSRRYAGKDGNRPTDYFTVVAWRQLAEICHEYLAKGRKVAVVGELQTRSYEAKDGTKRYITEILAEEVQFLTPKEKAAEKLDEQGFTDIEDGELPF